MDRDGAAFGQEWSLLAERDGDDPRARFPDVEIEAVGCELVGRSRDPFVGLALWSPPRYLPPGESIRVEVDYGR